MMTVSPLAALALACPLAAPSHATTPAAPTTAQGSQDSGRDWVLLHLPAPPAALEGPGPLLDGQHLRSASGLAGDVDRRGSQASLGPLLLDRSLEDLLRSDLDHAQLDARLQTFNRQLIVRGDAPARDFAQASFASLQSELAALSFGITCTLVAASEDGETQEYRLEEARTLTSGTRADLGARKTRPFVVDFDVEIAPARAIANPVLMHALSGETVHLWPSSVVDADGKRSLFVEGLLDLSEVSEVGSFDPDVFELGALEQPVVSSTQIRFSGQIEPGQPLVVEVLGMPGDLPLRRLEIGVQSSRNGDAPRVVDLARGLFSETTQERHGIERHVSAGAADRRPAGAALTPVALLQLDTLLFGREPMSRPVAGEQLLVLGAADAAVGPRIRALVREVEPSPVAPGPLTVEVDGLRVQVPTAPGSVLRVARSVERTVVTDYDPQVAHDAALSDPTVELVFTGVVLRGQQSEDGEFRGVVTRLGLSDVAPRDADPMDVGRIQRVEREVRVTPLRLDGSSSAAAANGVQVSR